jgi:GAF domain-containing protein
MKESEHAVSELAFLFKLLPVMQEMETVDKIYRLLLAIATTGESIGYRRAMLFVVDEPGGVIRGRFGVERAADSKPTKKTKVSFEDRAREVFAVYEGVESNDVTLQVRGFSVPTAWHRSALVKAAGTTYPVLAERGISEYSSDPFLSFFGTDSYIAVPIKINGRVASVLAADRGTDKRRGSVEDISLLYSLAQQAAAAAQNLIDLSGQKRRARIARKLQLTMNEADTREKLEEGMRLALIMVARAVGSSGCLLKDLTRQKTLHIKTVQEYSPDAGEGDVAINECFDVILNQASTQMDPILGDSQHPLLTQSVVLTVAHFHATPLVAGDSVAGAIAVYKEVDAERPSRKGYSPEDNAFLALCAWIIAAKLEAVQLDDRIKRNEEFLEEVSSNLARERERSRLAERSIDFHANITGSVEKLIKLLASKKPYAKRFPTISEIVKDMDQYARQHVSEISTSESHFELMDIFELARRLVQEWSSVLEGQGIDTTVRIPMSGPSLLMDKSKITVALQSILRVTASCLKSGDKLLVECSSTEDRVLLCFADNSAGLPGDAISRLFMPFGEIKGGDEKKRALSLAGEIIQKHSGEILIKSSMSWKTILILSFPKRANSDRRGSRRDRRRRNERRSAVSSP